MCVNVARTNLFARADFLRVAAAAAAPFALAAADAEPALGADAPAALPPPPPGMTEANARAARLAAHSPFVRSTYAATEALARTIGDARLRSNVLAFMHDPIPRYAAGKTAAGARAIADRLAAAGYIKPSDPVSGIFPPGTLGAAHAAQPFWSAPGSSWGSHHAYPGGLCIHECFNATMATGFAQTYDRMYFSERAAVDRDTVIAAALYHDVMKTVVFQWRDDGTLLDELPIGGTGGHHVLSGAEAIARGESPSFVVTLLSAHAAPSLGDEAKVAAWADAAAIVAGVDPVAFGLIRRGASGPVLAAPFVPIEAFLNHLSDHDYVLSVHAMHAVVEQLKPLGPRDPGAHAWWQNGVLSRTSAIALYQTLATRGTDAFATEVRAADRTIS